MALSSGYRIGNYEVLSPAGAGGMGEVYRARDSRLQRIVAIKALPEGLRSNPDRLARFEQEARLLASLNHPNIAGIHGIEDAADGGGPYLVLEFVEGETLADRLGRGPLTVSDTLHLGTQIAAAVEAAHEKGIVHRDLKPGNIMITSSGTAKVLDFGLAKDDARDDDSALELSASPTLAPATADGMVLGTAPYMSPEQARGRPADRRVDVWAYGCILMECLSGRSVFRGDTPSDVIARILEREPDWGQIPPATPPRMVDVIRRCLTKDVNLRPRDIGDIGRELRALLSDSSTSQAVETMKDVPSLAVLYFANLANDPDNEYFCSGITEDILTDLSKIRGLRVASKNAVSRYRGQEVDLSRIALDLGVTAVLEGSVRRAGDRIRITTQLINTSDGFQLWGERFDRTLEDVFAVQDEIATAIVDALRVAMTPSDIQEMARERPGDVRAYDLYLRGRQKYDLYEEAPMQEALALFQEAIAVEPDYALAWSGVADCYSQILAHQWTDHPEDAGRLGLEAARRAIAIDPRLPEAHKAEANVLSSTQAPMEEVFQSLTRALEVDPEFIPALSNVAGMSFLQGNIARAERVYRRILEIDPQSSFTMLWLSGILHWTQRPKEALTLIRRAREIVETDYYLSTLAIFEFRTQLDLGDPDAAERVLATAVADERIGSEALLPLRAQLDARRNRIDEARELVRKIEPGGSMSFLTLGSLVDAALRVGEPEIAVAAMESMTFRKVSQITIRLDHACHPLLDREQFQPRVSPLTLVWPLQAPMIDEARFRLFKEVRIESGRPEGSDFLGRASDPGAP